jgi:hypothetical protein
MNISLPVIWTDWDKCMECLGSSDDTHTAEPLSQKLFFHFVWQRCYVVEIILFNVQDSSLLGYDPVFRYFLTFQRTVLPSYLGSFFLDCLTPQDDGAMFLWDTVSCPRRCESFDCKLSHRKPSSANGNDVQLLYHERQSEITTWQLWPKVLSAFLE